VKRLASYFNLLSGKLKSSGCLASLGLFEDWLAVEELQAALPRWREEMEELESRRSAEQAANEAHERPTHEGKRWQICHHATTSATTRITKQARFGPSQMPRTGRSPLRG
jgi:hypothetical protein